MLHIHNLLNGVWFVDKGFATNYLPLLSGYLKGEPLSGVRRNALNESEISEDNGVSFVSIHNDAYGISEYGEYMSPESAPKNSVAVIAINGAITKYDQDCGPSGMLTKSNILQRCFANSNIEAVILRIDSGGGEGLACRLMQDTIRMKNKPVIAFVSDFAASAAYGIAAACDSIVASSEVARIGSIGTYITIVDYTEYYAKAGINLIEIYASKSTDKNQEYYQALKGNTAPLKAVCDTYNEDFINRIASFRADSLDADQSKWGTGSVFFAKDALKLGLIDEIDSFENLLNSFIH